MIKFRQKTYSDYEIMPVEDRFLPDPKLEEKYGKCVISFSDSRTYLKQEPLSMYKDRIKKLRKDVIDGYLYEDGPNGGETHWMKHLSTKKAHVYSKKINGRDRLNYLIKRPEVIDGKYVQKVRFENRVGHGFKKKTYSDKS